MKYVSNAYVQMATYVIEKNAGKGIVSGVEGCNFEKKGQGRPLLK